MKSIAPSPRTAGLVLLLMWAAHCGQGGDARKAGDKESGPGSHGSSAQAFVERIYREYQVSKDVNNLGPAADTLYAPELLRLIRKDEEQAKGEVGVLDGDPICDCQDYEISDVHVSIGKGKPDGIPAEVRFRNSGKEIHLTLSLVPAGKGWRIADIGSPSVPSLLKLLAQGAKPEGGAK